MISLDGLNWLSKRRCSDKRVKKRYFFMFYYSDRWRLWMISVCVCLSLMGVCWMFGGYYNLPFSWAPPPVTQWGVNLPETGQITGFTACCIHVCVWDHTVVCVCPFTSFTSQLLWVSSSLPFLSHSSSGCLVTAERWKFPIASLSPRMDGPRYLFRLRSEWPNNVCVCVQVCVCAHCFIQWTKADGSVLVHPVFNRHSRAVCALRLTS